MRDLFPARFNPGLALLLSALVVVWTQSALFAPEQLGSAALLPEHIPSIVHNAEAAAPKAVASAPAPPVAEAAAERVAEPVAAPAPRREAEVTLPADYFDLIVPVAGIDPSELANTFNAARSGGRSHRAIDIMAPLDTPVLAAADGPIVRLAENRLGGTTIFQEDADKQVVYYYAHLNRYAEGLKVGHFARQGEVIGYVGDTGNAAPGAYHLHFAIWLQQNKRRMSGGASVNPFPYLREARVMEPAPEITPADSLMPADSLAQQALR